MAELERVSSYKLLASSDAYYLFYHRSGLYVQKSMAGEPEWLCRLPLSWAYRALAKFRLTERIWRLEPRCAVSLSDHEFLISHHGAVYRLHVAEKTLVCEHRFRRGMHNPLYFCRYQNHVLYGEYFGNARQEGVAIYAREDGDWQKVFEFGPGTVNHIHNIIYDRYRYNFLILTGDEDSAAGIWQASLDFSEVQPLVLGRQVYRACVAFPMAKGLIYATDTPLAPNGIYFLDLTGGWADLVKIGDLPGPCIYGISFFDPAGRLIMALATSVEPDARLRGWRYLLTYRLGAGVVARQTHVFLGTAEAGFQDVLALPKDRWPMGLGQFGNLQFPGVALNGATNGDPGEALLYLTPVALAQYDGTTLRLPVALPNRAVVSAGGPKISVVMSVYNGERYLARGINSLINQTFTDWELIVCDDGSTDHTYRLLRQFSQQDSRIRVLRNTGNRGLAYSLNRAIRLARSNILARQDADDTSDPQRFAVQYPFVLAHPEYAIVGTGWYNVDDLQRRYLARPKAELEAKDLVLDGGFMHPTWMMRKDRLAAVGFYTVNRYTRRDQDYHLVMKLYGRGLAMYNLPLPLYNYTADDATFRRTKNWRRVPGLMWIRFDGYRRNRLPWWQYIFVFKPLLKNLLPSWLTRAFYRYRMGRNR